MATVSMEESSGMAIKKTAGPVMGGEAENNNSGDDKTDERAPLWPVTLATPPHGDIFSPAKPWGDKDSLHGMGLLKGLERGKIASRSSRRCALLLLESASYYEQFGVALLKACQSNPLEGDAFKSIASLSQQTRQLSNKIREEVALPLQAFVSTFGETIPAIHQKYVQSRQRASEARQRAVLARSKYTQAVQTAEEARKEVQEIVSGEHSDSVKPDSSTSCNTIASELTNYSDEKKEDVAKSSWEQDLEVYGTLRGQAAVDHVKHLLSDVGILQRRYQSLVEKENSAVRSAQTMETIALEGLQKLEEQRSCIFFSGLTRHILGIKESLDNLELSGAEGIEYDGSKEEAATKVKQKKGDLFATFLKVGITQPEKTGGSDAEILGLDEDVGRLRDQVQTRIEARSARIRKVKAMGAFFEDISLAALRLGDGLKQIIKQEASLSSSNNKGSPVEHLRILMKDSGGPRALNLWNNVVQNMDKEAEASLQFARALKSIKSSKLDHFLLINEKGLLAEADHDDARWKLLCDAARTELRAEGKYRQGTAQTVKARERVSSMDKDKDGGTDLAPRSPPKPSNRARDGMNKALGNMFKILPDGGEQAMSMLTPDARRAVVERNLQEADENELKLKQALDQAIGSKNRAVDLYRSKAEPLVKKYEVEDMAGIEDIKAAMESLVSSLDNLQKARYTGLPNSGLQPLVAALLDASDWAYEMQKAIAAKSEEIAREENSTASRSLATGFMLSVVLDDSEYARRLLTLTEHSSSNLFDTETSDYASKKEYSSMKDSSVQSANGSSISLEPDAFNAEKESPESPRGPPPTAHWLHKSFSTPMGKPDAFKTFKKFNSMGDTDNADPVDKMDDLTDVSTVSTTITPNTENESLETDSFLAFWPDYEGTPPAIAHSFACAYLPKDCTLKDVGSIEHGRLFLTHKSMVFVAWKCKKAILLLSGIVTVNEHEDFFGVTDDTLMVTAQKGKVQSTLLLSCFNYRDRALEALRELSANARKKEESRVKTDAVKIANNSLTTARTAASSACIATTPNPPSDQTIQRMDMVLSKKLRNIDVKSFHRTVWSDEKTTDESLYAQWMEKGDSYDIVVGAWQLNSDSEIKGPWCGENYTHKRVIEFKFKRTTHLYIGPPIAEVKQTQYCRLEEDRSVMQMKVEFDGIPYSDAFSVEVRWIASRNGVKDIAVDVGVFVEFHKNTILKSKIKSGTITETKPVHSSLFEFVRNALGEAGVIDEVTEDEKDGIVPGTTKSGNGDEVWNILQDILPDVVKDNMPDVMKQNMHIAIPLVVSLVLYFFWRLIFSSLAVNANQKVEIASLNAKVDGLQTEIKLMRQSLDEIAALLKQQATGGN